MAWLFKKKKQNDDLLKTFDGREVKYVTRREVLPDNTVNHNIVGKAGRIAVVNGEIRILCGEKDVFRGAIDKTKYFLLLSGDGVTVEGENTVTGFYESFTAYYSYYRK